MHWALPEPAIITNAHSLSRTHPGDLLAAEPFNGYELPEGGTAGEHQYLSKLAQARDVIYSVPAARSAVPTLGKRWVADGIHRAMCTARPTSA